MHNSIDCIANADTTLPHLVKHHKQLCTIIHRLTVHTMSESIKLTHHLWLFLLILNWIRIQFKLLEMLNNGWVFIIDQSIVLISTTKLVQGINDSILRNEYEHTSVHVLQILILDS